jgi:hypothetical protein
LKIEASEAREIKERKMRRIHQTTFGCPGGNCLAACLASIFKIELDEVPDFGIDDGWYSRFRDFMIGRFGVEPVEVSTTGLGEWIPAGLHLINGKSPRGDFQHALVGRAGKPVHDPHPDGNCELETLESYTVFVAVLDGKTARRFTIGE